MSDNRNTAPISHQIAETERVRNERAREPAAKVYTVPHPAISPPTLRSQWSGGAWLSRSGDLFPERRRLYFFSHELCRTCLGCAGHSLHVRVHRLLCTLYALPQTRGARSKRIRAHPSLKPC